jgi:hypothetical protein
MKGVRVRMRTRITRWMKMMMRIALKLNGSTVAG